MHGKSRRRGSLSDFGRQLQERQKFKLVYGLDERNLRHVVRQAGQKSGSTAVRIIELLESRLDNVVFRLGFASSRGAARQLVAHGHIQVNGRRVTSPGYIVRVKDVVRVRPESAAKTLFKETKESAAKQDIPPWLVLEAEKLEGVVIASPENTESPFEINLLVESFTK
jgi:small subunit ribosomal protein S4